MWMRLTCFRKPMALESSSICSLVSPGSASVRSGKRTLISGQRASHDSWSWLRKSLTVSSRRALRSTFTCSCRYWSCSAVRSQALPMRRWQAGRKTVPREIQRLRQPKKISGVLNTCDYINSAGFFSSKIK
jgi:hypothetical protein